ncbi:MAG: hypothetical protein LBG89_01085 [Rickettsiales bacterium]|jgi:hypothetical protein|nr:hypothetical protein [Rickettsiales bacterium]
MKKPTGFLAAAAIAFFASTANANWSRISDADDGGRFYFAVRGGAAFGIGGYMENKLGSVSSSGLFLYCPDGVCTDYISTEDMINTSDPDYEFIGVVPLGGLPVSEKFSVMTWNTNIGVGVVLPGMPGTRIEGSWDRISEVSYNASPFVAGETLTSENVPISVMDTGAITSGVQTDIFMMMAYFDFFQGRQKPARQAIPYIGLGLGYAQSRTSMSLIDSNGTLEDTGAFADFVDQSTGGFYFSENYSNGLAAGAAFGISYGINQFAFLDFGAKVIMANKVEWNMTNPNTGMEKAVVATSSPVIYGMVLAGFRFEF